MVHKSQKSTFPLEDELLKLHTKYHKLGVSPQDIRNTTITIANDSIQKYYQFYVCFTLKLLITVLLSTTLLNYDLILKYFYGIRCFVPNNYLIWEATRPISDCKYCTDLDNVITLPNVSRADFEPYAYSSRPILIKGAAKHWPAYDRFDFAFFRDLYGRIEGAVRSVDEECQFLHFKSDFTSLGDVFKMTDGRVRNEEGENSWYVGWGNCHPEILSELRKYYPKPHFLPEDCEIPAKDYVFMGFDAGATMHIDFINRLMWQAQLKGTKIWHLKPSNECEHVCKSISFVAEPGDAVLVDTRVWYHGTTIIPGQFSISIQSEYG